MKTGSDGTGPFPLGYRATMPLHTLHARGAEATPLATRAVPRPEPARERKSSVPPPPPTSLRVELGAAQARIVELEASLADARAECAKLEAAAEAGAARGAAPLVPILGIGIVALASLLGLAFDAGYVPLLSSLGTLGALFVFGALGSWLAGWSMTR